MCRHEYCEYCGDRIHWYKAVLELPCYASTKELYFCDEYCRQAWIEEHTRLEEIPDEDAWDKN